MLYAIKIDYNMIHLKKIILLTSICIISNHYICYSQHGNAKFFDAIIEEYKIPGLAVAVFQDGKLDYTGYHGIKATDTRQPLQENTIFSAASLSKPCFAYCVMKLVDKKIIGLDMPAYKYLENPELASDERYKLITIRMLLSHSSGLPNWRNKKLELIHNPGTKFQYSGEGFVYLAKIVETVLKKTINEIMQEFVFMPLGMNNSSYIWEDRFQSNYASPHDYTGHAKPNSRPNQPNIASSLFTTVEDYSKLMLALLNRQGLTSNSYNEIFSPQIEANSMISWGLGWGLQKTQKANAFWQWGDNGTFKAFAIAYPKQNMGMVFFTNSFKGLRVIPKVVDYLFADNCPAFEMLGSSIKPSQDEKLILAILNDGYEQAIKQVTLADGSKIDTSIINENQLDFVTMQLVWRKKYWEAKKLLLAKAITYPQSVKAQKSFADFCVKQGDYVEAIAYYNKVLKIDPNNIIVTKILEQLMSTDLKGNVTFELNDFLFSSSIFVVGSFNNWDGSQTPMIKKNGVWTTTIKLEPGTYEYRLVIDGISTIDPKNKVVIENNGQINSLLTVK
jgi:CubicO group peptidase (beta-lactamase class C family)